MLAFLDRVDGIWTGQLRSAAEAAGPDSSDQLVGLFDALGTACRSDSYRGCAFINAAAEAMPGTPRARPHGGPKAGRAPLVRDLAVRAGAADPDALARSLTLLLDGGLADAADPATATTAKKAARQLVGAVVGTAQHG